MITREDVKRVCELSKLTLSEEELDAIIKDTIQELGASSMKDMGKVMSAVISKTKGRADGRVINTMVKKYLS